MEPDFSTQHYRSYFFPSLRRELSLPCPLHLSGLRVTHRSPGCFFVYAFNFAPGHSRLIMVPHWDKQATLSKGSNAEDWEQSLHFSCWIFVLLSLLRASVEIVESGSCFCSEVRQSLITQGMSLSCKWMWPCVSLCLLVQEAVIGCSRSWPSKCVHVIVGVPSVTLAALLSQSLSGCKAFWDQRDVKRLKCMTHFIWTQWCRRTLSEGIKYDPKNDNADWDRG